MATTRTYASGTISGKTQQNKNKYENPYRESQKVQDSYKKLQEHIRNKPGKFTSSYQESMKDIYDRIMNREKFNFDMNSNVLYNQMKDQYASLGKLAMQDTMGQASALTGGYANSYAQTAGQQTYQNYMQQLNEQIPELYQMELNRYNMEGDEMYQQYGLAKGMYDDDYAKYRDSVSDFYTERDYLNGNYHSERDFDYNDYQSNRDYWNSQYWNEKNSASTSVTTGSGSGSGGSRKGKSGGKASVGSTPAPLSDKRVGEIDKEVIKTALPKQATGKGLYELTDGWAKAKQKKLLNEMYNNGKIPSAANLNYLYDRYGL